MIGAMMVRTNIQTSFHNTDHISGFITADDTGDRNLEVLLWSSKIGS